MLKRVASKKSQTILYSILLIGFISLFIIFLIPAKSQDIQQAKTSTSTNLLIKTEVAGIKIVQLDKDAPCEVTGKYQLTCDAQKGLTLQDSRARIISSVSSFDDVKGDIITSEEISKSYDLKSIDNSIEIKDDKVIFDLSNLKPYETFHYGENSTLVQLDYTHDLADGRSPASPTGAHRIQMKWDLRDIPAGVTIDNAVLCMNITDKLGTPSSALGVSYVNNQTWNETAGVGIGSQLNHTTETMYGVTEGLYSCINVTKQLTQSYSNSNSNFTLTLNESVATLTTFGGATVMIVGRDASNQWTFGSREAVSGLPYLNVTYTSSGTPATNVSSCGILSSSGSYVMNQSILNSTNSGNCITLSADNLVLDCQGYTIDGTSKAGAVGVYLSNKNNITIKNCRITDFRTSIGTGASLNQSLILNNSLYNAVTGVSFSGSFQANNYGYDNILNNSFYTMQTGISSSYFNANNATGNYMEGITGRVISVSANSKNWRIYNNNFNSSVSILASQYYSNMYNTTLENTPNIIGGSYIGGNYYKIYSENCTDSDTNGICDDSFSFIAGNIDYLPLSVADNTPPTINITKPINGSIISGEVVIETETSSSSGIKNVSWLYTNSTDWTYLGSVITAWNTPYRIPLNASNLSNGVWYVLSNSYNNKGINNSVVNTYTINNSFPSFTTDTDIYYPSSQSSVRLSQSITLIINTTSPYGISNVHINLENINGTGLSNMTFMSGSVLPDEVSEWNLTIEVTNTNSGSYTALIFVNDTLGNSNEGNFFPVEIDNSVPTYSSNSETPNPVEINNQIDFSITLNDNFRLRNYTFSTNMTGVWVNESSDLSSVSENLIIHKNPNTAGVYGYFFSFYDDAGNYNQTDERTFNVSSAEVYNGTVAINLVYPTDNQYFNYNTINLNYTFTGVARNCSLILDGNYNDTDTNPSNISVNTFLKTFNETSHVWSIDCIENYTNESFSSSSRSFIVDTTKPLISILAPENKTYSSNLFKINFTATDDYLSVCKFSSNDGKTNTTISCSANYSATSSIGHNNWTIYLTDLAGNFNSSKVEFTIDNVNPYFLNTPYNIEGYTNQSVSQQVNATDNMNISSYSINSTYSKFTINSSGYFYNSSELTAGLYWFNLTISDANLNKNYSVFYVNISTPAVLDIIPPYFNSGSPYNMQIYNNQSSIQKINATDETGLSCFKINDTANFNIDCSGNFNNITALSIGRYNINVSINDTANNWNSTLFYINISNYVQPDTTPPTFTNCRNLTSYVNSSFSQSILGTDETGFDSYMLNNTSNFTIGQTTGLIINVSELIHSEFYWLNLTINDTSNNRNDCVFSVNITELASDVSYPIFSNDSISIINNSDYNPLSNYIFNVTIINTNGTAGLEFNGVNYTMLNISSDFNTSILGLSPSNFSYYFWSFGNGTNNLYNTSGLFYYSVKEVIGSGCHNCGQGGGGGGISLLNPKNITLEYNKTWIENINNTIKVVIYNQLGKAYFPRISLNLSAGVELKNNYKEGNSTILILIAKESGSKEILITASDEKNITQKASFNVIKKGFSLPEKKPSVVDEIKSKPVLYWTIGIILLIVIILIIILAVFYDKIIQKLKTKSLNT